MKKIPDPKKMKKIKGPKINSTQVKNAKVRITTYLDEPVLDQLRALAENSGTKYQSILNQILKDYFFNKKEGLISRINRLEEEVFKNSAA